jgi:hypothetical protein
MLLVAAEADGTITVVQQAALDALRPICEQQGMALPGKAEPDPIFETVVVQPTNGVASGPTSVTGTTSTSQVYEEHEDEYEEHEQEYEEHEQEYEEHEEHERGDD